MSCVLRINGASFRVGEFLHSTNLKPYKLYCKGEKDEMRKGEAHHSSGCSFDLSLAVFDNFEQQKKDTIEFLKVNYEQLKSVFLFGLADTENPVIDFGINTRMTDIEVQSDYLEPELLRLAGNLNFGIEISQYQTT